MKENVREWIRVEECGRVGVNAKRKKSEGGRMGNRYEEAQRIDLPQFATKINHLVFNSLGGTFIRQSVLRGTQSLCATLN